MKGLAFFIFGSIVGSVASCGWFLYALYGGHRHSVWNLIALPATLTSLLMLAAFAGLLIVAASEDDA